MEQRERLNDPEEAVRTALDGFQARVWTALPAILQSFDATTMTASVQPSIQGKLKNIATGAFRDVNLPLCTECPVIFPGGGGFVLTFPLLLGDEGLLVFASRCIDAWHQNGGVQTQAEFRMHDLSDGFFIPNVFSVPKVPASISTHSVQLRSNDGLSYVEMASGHICNIVAPGGINITGPFTAGGVTISGGNVTGVGNIDLSGYVKAGGAVEAGVGGIDHITLQHHVHISGAAGFNTQPPTAGT